MSTSLTSDVFSLCDVYIASSLVGQAEGGRRYACLGRYAEETGVIMAASDVGDVSSS